MQINDFPLKLLINFALPVLILFFFSVFYTDHYKPSLFQGDELTYLKFAKEMNENNFHFFERLGFSISVSLNFLWPLLLSYIPSLELEGNYIFHFLRIILLVLSVILFNRTFDIKMPVVILMTPFLFQASIYAGTLYRDDVIFSFMLIFISFIHRNTFSFIALIFLFLIITLRASLGAVILPLITCMLIEAMSQSKTKTKIYFFILITLISTLFITLNQGLISYAFNIISNTSIDLFNFLRPFFSPINPLLVEGEIRYNNPIIFILLYVNKIVLIFALAVLLFFKHHVQIDWKIIIFSLFFMFPYFLFPENLGMRQAIGFQFIVYSIFINALFKFFQDKQHNPNAYE